MRKELRTGYKRIYKSCIFWKIANYKRASNSSKKSSKTAKQEEESSALYTLLSVTQPPCQCKYLSFKTSAHMNSSHGMVLMS